METNRRRKILTVELSRINNGGIGDFASCIALSAPTRYASKLDCLLTTSAVINRRALGERGGNDISAETGKSA